MKKEKNLLLEDIKFQIQKSPSFFIAQYQSLSANKANDFRREIAKVGGSFEVVRKRLFLKAVAEIGIEFPEDLLQGHVGLVFGGKDALDVSKAVLRYSDENEKAFTLLGGIIDGEKIVGDDVKRIATLPCKDEMRAQILGLLERVPSELLGVIDALLTSVMHCIENKAQKEETN